MSAYQVSPSVRAAFDSDGAVVMHIEQGLMYASNSVGGRILELLSQGRLPEQIVSTISQEWDVVSAKARADIEKYLELLRSYQIVELKDHSL